MPASDSGCILGLPGRRLGSGSQLLTSEDSFWVTILVLPVASGVFWVTVLVLLTVSGASIPNGGKIDYG